MEEGPNWLTSHQQRESCAGTKRASAVLVSTVSEGKSKKRKCCSTTDASELLASELWVLIFSHLSPVKSIFNLRLVCHKFLNVVDDLVLTASQHKGWFFSVALAIFSSSCVYFEAKKEKKSEREKRERGKERKKERREKSEREKERKKERERDVGIICVIIHDDLALEAWTQERERQKERWQHQPVQQFVNNG